MKALICLVEDYADNRVLVSALLTAGGLDVEAVGDGESLFRLLEAGIQPDLFLLDLSLPGEDGTTLMRRLKADERWRGRPVVALTAHAIKADVDWALAQGFDGYITKPVDVATFATTIRRFLS
ncbi:MAG: response regulator [Candidatus Dormibacteria bacterium]